MKFVGIDKVNEGKYITRYNLTYRTSDNKEKVYEMISRHNDIETYEDLTENDPEAVVLIIHDTTGEKVLINKEFRLATGKWVMNFPAGLIDPGETPEIAAKRELWEETGLNLDSIDRVLGVSYSSVGFTNEKNVCIVGTASGEFKPSTSTSEEIEAKWYTKDEVRELMQTQPFAARTQGYCFMWINS